jgi:uncharacterized protein YqeY
MSMKERLAEETKDALRSGQKLRLSTLRLLSAAVKNREVELLRELDDDEFVEVAGQEAKRRRDAIEAYEQAGRDDRAATEREELAVLQEYLPAGLTDQEVDALIDDAIARTGASGPGDMGKVMGAVMAGAKGRADGKAVQARVRQRLG